MKTKKNMRLKYRRQVMVKSLLVAALMANNHDDDLSVPFLKKEDLFRDRETVSQ